jgi:Na+-driven multidrug efflux pump
MRVLDLKDKRFWGMMLKIGLPIALQNLIFNSLSLVDNVLVGGLGLSLFLGLTVSVPFLLIGTLFSETFVGIFTDDPNVIRIGASYLRVLALTFPISAITSSYGISKRGGLSPAHLFRYGQSQSGGAGEGHFRCEAVVVR